MVNALVARGIPPIDFPMSVSLAGLSLVAPRPLESFIEQTTAKVESEGRFKQQEVLYTPFYPPPVVWVYRCITCRIFQGDRTCGWIEGDISPNGWCTIWVPKVEGDPPFSWLTRLPASLLPVEEQA